MRYRIHKGDNLKIMNRMEEEVDMIYLDPPFNTGKDWTGASGATFKDTWNDVTDEEGIEKMLANYPRMDYLFKSIDRPSDTAYLKFMALRLIECHRLLKETGSIFLHCDSTMSHSLKMLMDIIFGKNKFINEIIWCYTGPAKKKGFTQKHDNIYWYSKTGDYTCNIQRVPHKDSEKNKAGTALFGDKKSLTKEEEDAIHEAYRKKGKQLEDWWIDVHSLHSQTKERLGYPTQKPLKLLTRIIETSTNPGDIILDPFMGSGTTLEAGVSLDRIVVGIDLSQEGVSCVKDRMLKAGLFDITQSPDLTNYLKTLRDETD